jgi:hypothetical protein
MHLLLLAIASFAADSFVYIPPTAKGLICCPVSSACRRGGPVGQTLGVIGAGLKATGKFSMATTSAKFTRIDFDY